jgi:predicted NAD/FAD-binding protein
MRIAIVGSGVSGLVCAHRLQAAHEVVLFEAASRPGGHTHTVFVDEDHGTVPVDTGFIVFNTRTYPNFVALLRELEIDWAESNMSFSVSSARRNFEYNARNLSTLFAQRRRLLSPRFYRMAWDILRFYRDAPALLDDAEETPLAVWLADNGYSRAFAEDHLVPMIRALWSARRTVAEQFPTRFLVRFFANHGFLQVNDRPGWLTIPGGADRYVQAIARRLRGQLRLSSPVQRVRRQAGGIVVETQQSPPEVFDHLVFACHSDQALAMLDGPTALERQLLSAIPYQPNEVVLHTDASVMPRLSRSWGSWNVHLDDDGADGACITYWMNSLQPLPTATNYFVSLNYRHAIDPQKIVRVQQYEHPLFDLASVAAQARHAELIDHRGLSYCGAYWRNGFHEDGVVSALAVCERLLATQQGEVAA